jgi:glutamate N-acetyltransferase/amino-acid N-acetyltransferase
VSAGPKDQPAAGVVAGAAGSPLAPGFHGAATACGLKPSGSLDLALVWADAPCAAAGVFTTNRVQAAPVVLDRETLARSAGAIRAVIANSGCANAVTGPRGLADARHMAELAAAAIGARADQVLVLSTGVIGAFLDMTRLAAGVEALKGAEARRDVAAVARAVMTTDTRPKVAEASVALGGRQVVIRGFAKGAGMIHPNMATMLAVVTTDARITPARLDACLRSAVARSFNRISVDGDMSTNDTLLALASGASGVEVDDTALPAFTRALTDVCASLARQIARDGEGATRLVEIAVAGARTEAEAHQVGDSIARSPLVKTAIHGNDPNWGRILAAAGYSGADLDPARVRLAFGHGARAITLLERGMPVAFDRAAASELLSHDPAAIRLDLGLGEASAVVWTCDLSAEYVRVNAEYTT